MAKVITDNKKINELLTRGVEEVIDFNDLKKKLESGKKLRIKLVAKNNILFSQAQTNFRKFG